MKAGFILIMMFSPMSQYFAGRNVEHRETIEQCLTDAKNSVGKKLHEVVQRSIAWEWQMMGTEPKVISAFCTQGAIVE